MFGPVGGRGRGRGGRDDPTRIAKKKKWQEELEAPSPPSDYELPPSPRDSPSSRNAAEDDVHAAAPARPSSSKRSRSDVFKSGNPHVYMSIAIDGRDVGRLEFELFAREVPRTAENFRALCAGDQGVGRETGVALDYTSSTFHRIIPGFMAQGGDFQRNDGTGGESIYGGHFADESLSHMRHTERGLLSMVGFQSTNSKFLSD